MQLVLLFHPMLLQREEWSEHFIVLIPRNRPYGTQWSVSETGRTKLEIAKLWFTDTFISNISPERPQLLILDGHGSHNFVELLDKLDIAI